jgi:hypothetical protein
MISAPRFRQNRWSIQMTNFFYIGFAINAVIILGILGLSVSGYFQEFQKWISGGLFLLIARTAGAWAFHRMDRAGLASLMAWFTAILLPGAFTASVLLVGWLQSSFKGGFR